jgi:hypothetical protein
MGSHSGSSADDDGLAKVLILASLDGLEMSVCSVLVMVVVVVVVVVMVMSSSPQSSCFGFAYTMIGSFLAYRSWLEYGARVFIAVLSIAVSSLDLC